MKKIITLYFLFQFFSSTVFSANCDSIVFYYYHSDYSGDFFTSYNFTVDSLHRIIQRDGNSYRYDSLNRVIYRGSSTSIDSMVYDDVAGVIYLYQFRENSGTWELRNYTEEHLGVNGKDSVTILKNYNITPPFISYRHFIYFSSDSLSSVVTLYFDSINMLFSMLDSTTYNWSPDFLFYSAEHFQGGSLQLASLDSVRYDSLGRMTMEFNSGSYIILLPGFLKYYVYSCNNTPYVIYSATVGGGPQSSGLTQDQWIFDSLCRPVSYIGTFYSNQGGGNHHGEIYYADCNNILVLPHSVQLCSVDSVYPSPQVYGGTGILTYQWTPSDSVSDPTILNPILLGTTPQLYTLTITDQNGNSFIDSMDVGINSFTSIETDATCQTCNDGSILITPSNLDNEITISPFRTQQSPGLFMNLLPRAYWICSNASNCATCDSVVVGDLSTTVIESGKDLISVSPNPFSERIIIRSEISSKANSEWKLFDATTRLLKNGSMNDSEILISTNDLTSGFYFLEISGEENHLLKLIKN